MQETQVQSLGQGDPPEEEMETHSSILAWKIPWTEEPGGQATVHMITEWEMTDHTPSFTQIDLSPALFLSNCYITVS